ncbi:MAG TPA: hypothetical protein VNF26_07855 [Candidatus Baltobacterales bacterium]|nr:hypothetical protein [Candidatus Baltobacterales bacterium]
MAGPVDMSDVHAALDRLRPQLCHCGLKGECLGCKGIEMIRAQAEAVVAAASQPILLQVAQESSMKDMATRFQAMSERLMSDPDIRRSAEQMQERLMADPETRQLLEELMRRLGDPSDQPD